MYSFTFNADVFFARSVGHLYVCIVVLQHSCGWMTLLSELLALIKSLRSVRNATAIDVRYQTICRFWQICIRHLPFAQ